MKKVLSLILAMTLVLSLFVVSVTAELPEIRVILDGEQLEFDVPPQIIDNRTMVPMRAIFEALGKYVMWFDDEYEIAHILEEALTEFAEYGFWNLYSPAIMAMTLSSAVVLQIDNPMMLAQLSRWEVSWVELEVLPQIVDNRTLVPVRAISEGLNAEVDWCGDMRTVTITT